MKIFIFLMIIFIVTIDAKASASKTLREQMVEYESKKVPIEFELDKIQVSLSLISSRYGNSFAQMDAETLKSYIDTEKKYYLSKEALAEELNHIYIPNYSSQALPIDVEINNVLRKLAANCNLLLKITSKCLDKKENLIFQAEYLKQKIEALETIGSSIESQINAQIIEDDLQDLKSTRL